MEAASSAVMSLGSHLPDNPCLSVAKKVYGSQTIETMLYRYGLPLMYSNPINQVR
jgi:hypothetical protein